MTILSKRPIALVETHLPEVDTLTAKRRIGWRKAGWDAAEVARAVSPALRSG